MTMSERLEKHGCRLFVWQHHAPTYHAARGIGFSAALCGTPLGAKYRGISFCEDDARTQRTYLRHPRAACRRCAAKLQKKTSGDE